MNNALISFLIFTLILFFTACTKPIININSLKAKSGEIVKISANEELPGFRWIQVSGIPIVLVGANSNTLSFVAPEVESSETLVFELQAVSNELLK